MNKDDDDETFELICLLVYRFALPAPDVTRTRTLVEKRIDNLRKDSWIAREPGCLLAFNNLHSQTANSSRNGVINRKKTVVWPTKILIKMVCF